MKIIKHIDENCYYKLEAHGIAGLRSTIKAGDMFLIEWYKDDEDVQQIIEIVIEELKLRAKISRSHRTLYNIERLLPKIEKLTKNEQALPTKRKRIFVCNKKRH